MKKLNVQIYYKNNFELSKRLKQIERIENDVIYTYNDENIKFEKLELKEPKYRVEEINGFECMIFESKMNHT